MSKNYGNDSQIAEIVKYISDTMKFPIMGAGGGFAPIGTINSYMGTTAPIGWLACDGTVYNIADYPDLATHIASHFGSTDFFGGNGTTTFGVPDLRGEFLRGSGTNSHTNQGSGANVGVHQDGTQQNILYEGSQIGVFAMDSYGQYCANADSRSDVDGQYVAFSKNSTGTSTGFPTVTSRPTNTSVLFIVKATLSDAELNAFNVYTPREHQVAWWEEEIDGVWKRKPVYEKRVDCGAMPNNTTKEVAHGISNLDFIVSDECHTKNPTNGQELTLPHAWYEAVGGAYILFDATKISLTTKADLTSFTKTEVVLKYTKTTDEWQPS